MLSPVHAAVAEPFLADLAAAVDESPAGGDGDLGDVSYGGIA